MKLDTIGNLGNAVSAVGGRDFDNGEFLTAVKSAIAQRKDESQVIISSKFENAASQDPDLWKEIQEKLEQMRQGRDNIIIVDRNGEIKSYSTKNDRPEHPTAEELKEVAKARARRKAKLDAYFHLLEKVCIKRKLIEQENAKRTCRKKYRSVTELGLITKSRQLTTPPKNPNYFF